MNTAASEVDERSGGAGLDSRSGGAGLDSRSGGAGLAAVVGTALVFSWGFIIVKAVPLPAGALAFWRLAIGAAVLVATALVLRTPWPRRRGPMLAAGVAFGVHQLLFIAATQPRRSRSSRCWAPCSR
jgi:hypothetical protein